MILSRLKQKSFAKLAKGSKLRQCAENYVKAYRERRGLLNRSNSLAMNLENVKNNYANESKSWINCQTLDAAKNAKFFNNNQIMMAKDGMRRAAKGWESASTSGGTLKNLTSNHGTGKRGETLLQARKRNNRDYVMKPRSIEFLN